MKKNELFETYYQKLSCKIYVLGGPSQGESVIFLLYGDQELIYSCVTDSFTFKGNNYIKDFLNSLNIQKLDALFWTHPHDDHTEGMVELITSFCPKNIYIPSAIIGVPLRDLSPLAKKTLDMINMQRGFYKTNKNVPRVSEIQTNLPIEMATLKVNSSQVEFLITTVFPVNGRIRQDIVADIDNYINDFSIGINISVGDFSCLLTGDVQDDMVYYASTELLNEVPIPNILKIPHHGSKGSTKIIDLFQSFMSEFNSQTNVSVTTSKKASRLPRIEALNKYSSRSEKLLYISPEAADVAIWGIEVDILDATIKEICRDNFSDYNVF